MFSKSEEECGDNLSCCREGENRDIGQVVRGELSDRRDLGLALGQKMSCDNSPTEEIQDQMSDGRQSMVCEVVVEDSFCIA